MKREQEEIRVVSRNAFSKLRLTQFIFALIVVIGFIGTWNQSGTIFIVMFLIGIMGLIVIRILRWMHRD